MSEGTMFEGTVAEGALAEGTMAEGAVPEGTMSEVTVSEGTVAEGTVAELGDGVQNITLEENSTGADAGQGSVTCKDENNHEVDWYILYKTPKNQEKQLSGLDYVYIHPDKNNQVTHKLSKKTIDDADGILANTLRPLFTEPRPPNFGFISYNDEVPKGYSARVLDPNDKSGGSVPSTFGHSKGVVMVEKDQKGVWLSHSTRQFPSSRDPKTFYPKSGTRNAQIFICVTFNYDQFKAIGEHLQKIRAFPFDHHIPSDFHEELQAVTRMEKNSNRFTPMFQQLTSSGGKTFHSIAKQVSDQPEVGDLYVSISNKVDSDVNVQTWGGQQGRDGSYRTARGKEVKNIKSVRLPYEFRIWGANVDHSKWCVAVDTPWTCIADVNRSKSQYERLGGALCVNDEEIRNIFMSFILEVEE